MKKSLLCTLLAIVCVSTLAQTKVKYGDWIVSKFETISVATTTNDSGSTIGWLCLGNADACGPYIAVSAGCDEKATYPILINSPVGAFHATTTCTTIGDGKYYLINEVDIFRRAAESGGEIGIAFPMQDGKFRVSRFSTVGAITAIKEATTFPKTKKSTNLRMDQSL